MPIVAFYHFGKSLKTEVGKNSFEFGRHRSEINIAFEISVKPKIDPGLVRVNVPGMDIKQNRASFTAYFPRPVLDEPIRK
jgi:hypothetical protein